MKVPITPDRCAIGHRCSSCMTLTGPRLERTRSRREYRIFRPLIDQPVEIVGLLDIDTTGFPFQRGNPRSNVPRVRCRLMPLAWS
ncbi:hypothetical protein MBEHAL_2384 [Halarchaeum acidiphilum MH1-52-1]|uniref:Uncharacterized protein n=1 Tax=Halarchaeum acidiphilum MH1-52-1 TaxID=1261545 RepID=U3A7G1_9EURY|nr:hypothetical protein MBEHAL_2384 [Halarchaeum acidiphilum MH1-52-1]